VIELDEFRVEGLKSLARTDWIPVRAPTIVTGANDGGKSTTLQALDFLLDGDVPHLDDHTKLGAPSEGAEPLRSETVVVEGRLALGEQDAADLGLDRTVTLRRVADTSGAVRHETLGARPVDERLRDVEARKVTELKALGGELGIEPSGPANQREAWLVPLRAHVAQQPHEEAWIPAGRELVARLPILMPFSSTAEPDPEAQIRGALHSAYKELLDDEELVGPVRAVEDTVQTRLAQRADELCHHVAARCPELDRITVRPDVRFSEGFRSVQILAARPHGAGIPLNQSGAGRRRRINLAVWEWTGDLLSERSEHDRSVIIAYDEPDTHLDYGHQRELVSLIRKQCEKPGVRMLVATHSLNLIDRVSIEDVVHLRLADERTTVERLIGQEHDDVQRYLIGVSDAMGLRNSVLLHERCFAGVEGPTEMQALPVLFRLATGMSLQSAGIALISGNGNSGALDVVRFLKHHDRRLTFLLVDADSSDGKIFSKDNLRAAGIGDDDVAFVGERELEDLFTDEQWAAAANRDWPRDDEVPWTTEAFGALRSGSKFSGGIANLVRAASSRAPSGKPGYLVGLVQGLEDPADVPPALVAVFERLVEQAAA